MRLAAAISLLLVITACGEPRHDEPQPARVASGTRAVAAKSQAATQTPTPRKDPARQRRRANVNGWVDLSELPDDLFYAVATAWVVSGVVELEPGSYRLKIFRVLDTELDRVSFDVRAGAVTRIDASGLNLEEKPVSRNGCHAGCRAVDLKAEWITTHQAPDGSWGATDACGHDHCDVGDQDSSRAATTGLSLLPFLAAGETHQTGEYKQQVKKGLRYLKNAQTEDGWFVEPRRGRTRSHAIATLALTEAYGLTGSRLFKGPSQKGIDALLRARGHAVPWTRDDFGGPDAETTAWAVFCLKSAKLAEIDLPETAFADAHVALDAFGDPGAMPGLTPREIAALTAARLLAGAEPNADVVRGGVEKLLENLPMPDSDPLYVYFGSIATFQVGGKAWRRWNEHLKFAVVDHQRTEKGDHARSSWDTKGPEAVAMGRLRTTVVSSLTLSIYYRYGRVFGARR